MFATQSLLLLIFSAAVEETNSKKHSAIEN